MKTKNISLAILSTFVLVFFLAFASASFTLTQVTPTSQVKTAGDTTSITFDFNVSASGTNYTSFSLVSPTTTAGGTWTLTQQSALTAGSGMKTFKAKLSFQGVNTVLYSGQSINSLINLTGTTTTGIDNSLNTLPITITFSPNDVVSTASNEFCSLTSTSDDLDLGVDISNKGTGDDGTWNILDTIEVKVKFDNNLADPNDNGLYNLDDGTFKLKLLDSNGHDVAGDLIWISDDSGEYEFGSLDEGKKTDHTFIFRVNPAEFTTDENYDLVVEVTAKDDDNAEHCIDYSSDLSDFGSSVSYAHLKINQENNEVVVDTANPLLESSTASCEQQVTLTADVWNTGANGYSDQIAVNLYNEELGINETKTISEDLDSGDKTQVTFTFTIPKGMTEDVYDLKFTTYYDWDSEHSEYKRSSDDGEYTLPFTLSGNCILPEAMITAALQPETETKAGKPLFIIATITNTGSLDSTYTFALDNYSSWASGATINNSITLAAGESGTVLISLDVGKKVSGKQTFNILATSEGVVFEQVVVTPVIEERQGLDFLGNNGAVTALIALITAIAIAIIIVLIVKASKKK